MLVGGFHFRFTTTTKNMHISMFQKHIHKVKFYPSADDFTQAPLVMLVTNIMSASDLGNNEFSWLAVAKT